MPRWILTGLRVRTGSTRSLRLGCRCLIGESVRSTGKPRGGDTDLRVAWRIDCRNRGVWLGRDRWPHGSSWPRRGFRLCNGRSRRRGGGYGPGWLTRLPPRFTARQSQFLFAIWACDPSISVDCCHRHFFLTTRASKLQFFRDHDFATRSGNQGEPG